MVLAPASRACPDSDAVLKRSADADVEVVLEGNIVLE